MSFNCSFKMASSNILLLLLIKILSFAQAQNQVGSCRCDFLVTVSTFQTGVCGRAARCYWELSHLKMALKGDFSLKEEYSQKIKQALKNIPTYKMHRDNTEDEKDWFQIFESETLSKEDSMDYDHYPLPTYYTMKVAGGGYTILPQIQECKEWESSCTQELDKEIYELCDIAMTDAGRQKIEDSMNVKIDGQNAYELIRDTDTPNGTMAHLNKCTLKVYTRRKEENGEYLGQWILNEANPRLRPPYFDLAILYKIDPHNKMQSLPDEDRWWNETKAIRDLPNYLPLEMIMVIHKAIKHIYDSRQGDSERGKAHALEWRPEKFCGTPYTFVCMNENVHGRGLLHWRPSPPPPPPPTDPPTTRPTTTTTKRATTTKRTTTTTSTTTEKTTTPWLMVG